MSMCAFVCMCTCSLIAQLVKNPPAMQESPVRALGWEDPLEKGMATHSHWLCPCGCGIWGTFGLFITSSFYFEIMTPAAVSIETGSSALA